ncbi:hypothetical protein K9N50_10155 [bacterium]|nr:hypothetical protein [bacterium]
MTSEKSQLTLKTVLVVLLLGFVFISSGCDWSARWDLRKAEKALRRADKVNAEHWCEKEYGKAQKAFDEAMDLARVRKINEARDKALEAYEWAIEAEWWAIKKAEEMEKEKESLNSKKY